MKKVVYTMEQMQTIASCLTSLKVTGIDNCKLIVLASDIIDAPVDLIEEDKTEEGAVE